MRMLFLAVFLLLAGCGTPTQLFEAGRKNFEDGNYAESRKYYLQCFNKFYDAGCLNNYAVAAERMGDMLAAKNSWTLAAQYGSADAVSNLRKHDWPVPAVINAPAQTAQPSFSQALGQGLQGAGAVLQSGGQVPQQPVQFPTYEPTPPMQSAVPRIDYACVQRCTSTGSQNAFCRSKCSY